MKLNYRISKTLLFWQPIKGGVQNAFKHILHLALEKIQELFASSDLKGSRTTIMRPLTWLLGFLITGLIVSSRTGLDRWVINIIATLLIAAILLYIFIYIYCIFKNPDALRSEKYSIQKMAMEKGYFGDSKTGHIEIPEKEHRRIDKEQQSSK